MGGGKPAARQGDMTRKGLDIVQGSAGVLIGAPTGVACSVCPGGITYANPVNPVLGAKVLPGETDLALPCPLPFILFRAYSSYRTRTPAPVGVFGPGWKAPFDIRLQIRDEGLILNDSGGRSIHFEPLFPGEISYSRSESLWLARGGVAAQHSSQPLSALWQVLPEDVRLSPHVYLATNSLQGPWWILSWPEPPAYRVLTVVVDGFGRSLTFHRAAEGDVAGAVTGVTDGAGRRFHMALSTQAQRAEASRKQRASSLSSPASPRSVSSSQVFPDTLPAGTEYGADNGIRLEAVWLTHDPAYPDEQPTAPLARYTYTAGGELRAVYDRSGTQVRGFTYDAEHAGRMVAHHYAGRPESRYRYDDTGRVTEQVNPEGLDYRFEYGESRVIITDSLNRREVLYTEGEGGLKRVVKKEHADGSITRSEYDEAGRLKAQTDAAGSLPGTKTQMTIRSKTYKGSGFNELKFDDATGKEQVYIHAQKNMNTEVLNNRTTDVINNHAETIGNNQMIAVTNNQIETVGVNQIETVGSNQIIKVGSVQVETIGLVRALTVGVAYQTTVGGIMNTSVALMQSSQIGLHKSLRVGLGYDVKVGNNVTFTVGKTKKDDTGQTAIYSAGEHLELCCGKARLVLTKDGQIFLNGTKIHLQGKEQVNGDSLLINWNCAASKSPPKTPDEKQDTPDMREY
ncbi:rhs core protein with extension [Shigella sonnei]|nr:rhs core protein with extension [Shigella sonnei]